MLYCEVGSVWIETFISDAGDDIKPYLHRLQSLKQRAGTSIFTIKQYRHMLPLNIQKMILDKLGLKNVSARDCQFIGSKLDASETTVKRFFGLIAESESKRTHFASTLNRVAEFLGYTNYRELCVAVEPFQNESEEIPSIQNMNISSLKEGSEIKLSHSQKGAMVMTYVGNGEFLVKETKDFKLFQGDRVRIGVEKAS